MPLYIAKNGDLDRCYRCLTDWLTHSQLKDRATQLLIKYKSGALVTQSLKIIWSQYICASAGVVRGNEAIALFGWATLGSLPQLPICNESNFINFSLTIHPSSSSPILHHVHVSNQSFGLTITKQSMCNYYKALAANYALTRFTN